MELNLPSDRLVERISNAIGHLYDPYYIKKGYRQLVESAFQSVAERKDLSAQEKI